MMKRHHAIICCSSTARLVFKQLCHLPRPGCAGVGAGHVSAVSCVAFARRGGGFVATGGADKLLKVRPGAVCGFMLTLPRHRRWCRQRGAAGARRPEQTLAPSCCQWRPSHPILQLLCHAAADTSRGPPPHFHPPTHHCATHASQLTEPSPPPHACFPQHGAHPHPPTHDPCRCGIPQAWTRRQISRPKCGSPLLWRHTTRISML